MRNGVAVDSGPLLALFNARQKRHADVVRLFERPLGPLITNWPVVTEVAYLMNTEPMAQRAFLAWTIEAIEIDEETSKETSRIVEILEKYEDLPADFADASLLALCERRGIERIATFDRDFGVYRTRARKRLKNVFEDR